MEDFLAEIINENNHYEYTIMVIHTPSNATWSVKKTLKDFHELYLKLSPTFDGLPVPPGYDRLSYLKSYFKRDFPDLKLFFQQFYEFPQVSTNQVFREFLGIYERFYEKNYLKVLKKDLRETFFPTKFIEKGENFILTGEVETNQIFRLEHYLEFIGIDSSPMSQIRCFGEFGSWRLSITDVLTCFKYNHRLTILCLGLESGNLMFIRIKTEKNSSEYENFGRFEVHSGPVCGIASDYTNSKVFSCSLDGKCIITSLATREMLLEINLSCAPNGLILSEDLKTLYFPTDREVFTYCLASLKETQAFQVDFLGFISFLCVSRNEFCIVGGFAGDLYVYNSDFVLIQKYQVFGSVQSIAYDENLKIVIVGDSKGTVSIWDNSAQPLLNLKVHDSVLTVYIANDEIFTAGNDKKLFTWKIEF